MRQSYIPAVLGCTAVLVGIQCALMADWSMAWLCAVIVVVMVAGRSANVGETPPADVLVATGEDVRLRG